MLQLTNFLTFDVNHQVPTLNISVRVSFHATSPNHIDQSRFVISSTNTIVNKFVNLRPIGAIAYSSFVTPASTTALARPPECLFHPPIIDGHQIWSTPSWARINDQLHPPLPSSFLTVLRILPPVLNPSASTTDSVSSFPVELCVAFMNHTSGLRGTRWCFVLKMPKPKASSCLSFDQSFARSFMLWLCVFFVRSKDLCRLIVVLLSESPRARRNTVMFCTENQQSTRVGNEHAGDIDYSHLRWLLIDSVSSLSGWLLCLLSSVLQVYKERIHLLFSFDSNNNN